MSKPIYHLPHPLLTLLSITNIYALDPSPSISCISIIWTIYLIMNSIAFIIGIYKFKWNEKLPDPEISFIIGRDCWGMILTPFMRLSWVVRRFLLDWASFSVVYMTVLEILVKFCHVSFAVWINCLLTFVWIGGSLVVGKEVYEEHRRRGDVGVSDAV